MLLVVAASGLTEPGTVAQRLVDNGLDVANATTAFHVSTETTVDMLGMAQRVVRSTDGGTDFVVGNDVARTNDHEYTDIPL